MTCISPELLPKADYEKGLEDGRKKKREKILDLIEKMEVTVDSQHDAGYNLALKTLKQKLEDGGLDSRIEGFKEGYDEGYEIGQTDKRKEIIEKIVNKVGNLEDEIGELMAECKEECEWDDYGKVPPMCKHQRKIWKDRIKSNTLKKFKTKIER